MSTPFRLFARSRALLLQLVLMVVLVLVLTLVLTFAAGHGHVRVAAAPSSAIWRVAMDHGHDEASTRAIETPHPMKHVQNDVSDRAEHAHAPPRVTDVLRSLPAAPIRRFERSTSSSSPSSSARSSVSATPWTTMMRDNAAATLLPVLYPTDFGADPTGVLDSSPAFDALVSYLLYNLSHPHQLSDGMIDLGGATIDLAGGDYTISRPIVIPPGYGNLRLQRGTLRALPNKFPSTSFMLQVGNVTSEDRSRETRLDRARAHAHVHMQQAQQARTTQHRLGDRLGASGQNCWIENIGVSEMMFDAQQSAAGCILINYCMGAVLGPQNFYLGFLDAGVSITQGHEVQIHASWFGEYLYSDPRKEKGNATAIEVLGNDHVLSDVVVFSSKIGVYVNGAANLINNVHTWNDATSNGGTGMVMDAVGYTQNRIIGSYLDYTDLVVVDPEHMLVTDCFFLGGAALVLRASTANHRINGLVVRDNMWDIGNDAAIQVDETAASFSALIDTVIEGNMLLPSFQMQSTRVRVSQVMTVGVAGAAALSVPLACFDLTQSLLFAQFAPTYVSATLQLDLSPNNPVVPSTLPVAAVVGGVRAATVPPNDMRTVCVGVDPGAATSAFNVTVFVTVEQSSSSQAFL